MNKIEEEKLKILLCIAKCKQRVGRGLAIDVLKGSHSVRVFNRRLQLNSAFGSLKELSEEELETLIQELEEEGMIVETEDEYPRLVLTEASKELLHDHVGELDL